MTQEDDDAHKLLRAAAREVMMRVAPYRVAVSDLAGVLTNEQGAIKRATETAQRGLNKPHDRSMAGATEIVLLHNLLGIIAMYENKPDVAEQHFYLGRTTPGAEESAYGLVALNHAFLYLMLNRTQDARSHYEIGRQRLSFRAHAAIHGRLRIFDALIKWQAGDIATAEAVLTQATNDDSEEAEPHYYLAQLYQLRGNQDAARRAHLKARVAARFDQHFASLAHTLFGMNMTTRELDVGAFLPPSLSARLNAVEQRKGGTSSGTPSR